MEAPVEAMRPLILFFLVTACAGGRSPSDKASPAVGVTTVQLSDDTRGRTLTTEIWYPAPPSVTERPELYLHVFVGHAARNAAVMPGPRRPLVVMSHGSGSFRQDLAWLAEDLVREGFIVVAPTHPANNYDDDDRLKRLMLWERPRDLSAVLTRLLEHPGWGLRVDGNAVGAVGFSLGGYTVLQLAGARYDVMRARAHCLAHADDPVCIAAVGVDRSKIDYAPSGRSYRDGRIKAAVALAPAGAPATDPGSVRAMAPVRIFSSRSDTVLPHAYYGGTWDALLPGRVTVLDGPDHGSFLTPCLPGASLLPINACRDPRGVDRAALHAKISVETRAFLRAQLTPQPLLR